MSNCGQCGGGGGGSTCTCFVENNCYPVDFFVDLPGTTGNYASTPDSAAVSITGDIDIRVKVSMDDWTPAAETALVGKYGSSNQKSFLFSVMTDGLLRLLLSQDGIGSTTAFSSVAPVIPNGTNKWVRVTWVNATDVVQFFTSDNGVTWTQLGANASIAVTGIFNSTAVVEIGSAAAGTLTPLAGNVYYAEIRNGIDGTVVAKFDPDDSTITPTPTTKTPSSFTSDTGEVWTLNGANWVWGSDEVCVDARGNGSLSHPFNFVSNHIPNPRPCGHIYRLTTPQTIAANVNTTIFFTNDYQPFTGNMTNLVATPTKLTAPVSGAYLVGGFIALFNGSSNSVINLILQKNGSTSQRKVLKTHHGYVGGFNLFLDVITLVYLTANDYIELIVNSTTAVDIDTVGNDPAYLWAQWMGTGV